MDPAPCTVKFKCPLHGAKFVVKFPREGTTEAFKCCTFAPPPPPTTPLRLNIDGLPKPKDKFAKSTTDIGYHIDKYCKNLLYSFNPKVFNSNRHLSLMFS